MSERGALRHATAQIEIDALWILDSTAASHVQQKVVVVHYYKVPTSIHPSYPILPCTNDVTDTI